MRVFLVLASTFVAGYIAWVSWNKQAPLGATENAKGTNMASDSDRTSQKVGVLPPCVGNPRLGSWIFLSSCSSRCAWGFLAFHCKLAGHNLCIKGVPCTPLLVAKVASQGKSPWLQLKPHWIHIVGIVFHLVLAPLYSEYVYFLQGWQNVHSRLQLAFDMVSGRYLYQQWNLHRKSKEQAGGQVD